MFDREKWSEVIDALNAKPFRTAITAFGVFWGIFILVILLSAGKGLENGVQSGFKGVAANSLFIFAGNTTMSYKGFSTGRTIKLNNSDLEKLQSKFPDLKYISPSNRASGSTMRGTKKGTYEVSGYYPNFVHQLPYVVSSGRFINYNDIQKKTKIAVIGEYVVTELFNPSENPIGKHITINGVSFLVVGTYHSNSTFNDPASEQSKIFIPYTTCQQAYNLGDSVGRLMLTAKDGASISDFKTGIQDVLKENHNVHPEDERAFYIFDLYEKYKTITGLFIILKAIGYFVGVLILLSGVIGISNIMLIVVKERTKEIGIRRALGATPSVIRSQLLLESLVLTLTAGMLGVSMATGIIWGVNSFLDAAPARMFVNPSVDLMTVIIALLILVFSGLLAGLIPAQIALKVKPIDALRDE